MNTSNLRVSVVIPTWNAAGFVERVLRALAEQQGVIFEVVVVDNGVVNRDTLMVAKSIATTEAMRDVRVLEFQELLGYAGAVNAGVAVAKCALVAVINNDNIPDKRWLAELLEVMDQKTWQGKPISVVTSYVAREGERPALEYGESNIWGRQVWLEGVQFPDSVFPVFHPDGSAFLFDKERIGLPYDKRYFIYHEDVYLGWRARLEGGEVLCAPRSRATTFDGGTTRRLRYKTAYYTERNRWINCILFPSFGVILRLWPLWFADALAGVLFKPLRLARVHAYGWILVNIVTLLYWRSEVQVKRQAPDSAVLCHLSVLYFSKRKDLNFAEAIKRGCNFFCRVYRTIFFLPLRG